MPQNLSSKPVQQASVTFVKKYFSFIPAAICMFGLLVISNVSLGQACSSAWTLTSSTTPVVTGNLTATAPTFGSGLTSTGNTSATYGTYAQNWNTYSSVGGAAEVSVSSNTQYIQFSVTPTNSLPAVINSLSITTANNDGSVLYDQLAIFCSTSSTFATSTLFHRATRLP